MDNLLFGDFVSRENYRILIVDDDESSRILFCCIIKKDKYTVKTASTGIEALQIAGKFKPHLILTDLKMPGMDGMSLINECKQLNSDTHFIVVTAYGNVDTAIKSMKMGVLEYILKPIRESDEFRHVINMAYERRTLMDENFALRNELDKDVPPFEIIFGSMEEIADKIRAVAPTNSIIRLSGETGTGKGLISKVIHQISGRKGPFVEINCASVPETLLESEFFGHEKGSFTGATSSKKGKFELATDGTIFLDEISEMDYAMQAKLLRVLQGRTFEKLGSNLTQITNARIICATNKDLHKAISEGKFREDLFFRLNVFPLELKTSQREKTTYSCINQISDKHYLCQDW
ncbi:MAG: sigma-54-dependent Fis family transcriptional regulator [Candidatus Brocadiaceae bacterium]|nr:sigma-54-dependent Fis family transcriptional regulator [Candidatus Brocadiaceae bacterium]